jgi:hypothetical protein
MNNKQIKKEVEDAMRPYNNAPYLQELEWFPKTNEVQRHNIVECKKYFFVTSIDMRRQWLSPTYDKGIKT